jgi:hypothetical protein
MRRRTEAICALRGAPLEIHVMTRTAFLAISAIAALSTTSLSTLAFDRDGRAPAARTGSGPAVGVGSTSVGVAGGNGASVVVGGNGVSVGGKGASVVVGGDGTSVVVGGKGAGVAVGGDGTSVVVGGTGVGGRGAGVAAGGDGTSVVVGGNGVSVGGRGTGVVVDGTSVVVGGNGVSVGGGAGVVVGGNGAAVGVGGSSVVVSPGLGPRVVTQTPGFKAMALGSNNSGAWVVRTSPSFEGASADALQICNSQFGGCTLSDARVAPTAFGCLVVAQSDDGDRVFAATGNSPDAARTAVSAQVASAGLHGNIAYAACNY